MKHDRIQRLQRPLLLAVEGCATLIELREHAARAIGRGFDGIEWHASSASLLNQTAISQLNAIPIRAVAVRCEMMDIPAAFASVSSQLQAASALGAKVLSLGIPPVRQNNGGSGFASYQDGLNFAYELLRQVRIEAEAAGVALALDAATGGCLLSPVEVRELIDAVNSTAVGACIDLQRIGAIGSPMDWIQILHRRIRAVRYFEAPYFQGRVGKMSQVPMETLIQALDNVSSDCPLILSRRAEES